MYNTTLAICFNSRPVLNRFSPVIYKALKKKCNLYGGFITSNKKETEDIGQTLHNYKSDIKIYEVSNYFRKHWTEFTYDKFLNYEKKYECQPIWNLIYTDRYLVLQDYEYCVKITAGYFQFFEEIFSNTRYDFYFDECISTLQSYLAYIVGKKTGVKYISQTAARGGIDDKYHYILADPMQRLPGFNNEYIQINYSTEEIKRADEFLTLFERKDMKPKYMDSAGNTPEFSIKSLLAPIKYMRHRFDPYKNDKYFYIYYQSYKYAIDKELYYFRYKRSRKFYNKADFKKKYVYFPLHYQPENSTLVCAPKYEKQLFFIDSWAKSLPADTLLYVKEHYTLLGNRPISFYKELKKYPNVIIIDPWENSRELIKNAVAVTTLTGSAGFEAMLLRKLVIICGNVLYENAPGVVKVDDIYQKYLSIIDSWKKPKRDETIKFLCEYFRCLSEGYSNIWTDECYEENNINKLAFALYNQMTNMIKNSN